MKSYIIKILGSQYEPKAFSSIADFVFQIFPADSEGKPRPEHLTTRAEYLLKNLPKLMTKSPTKAPKKKERKSRKKKKEEPEEDIREFFEENKPTKSRRKKRTKKEDPDEVEDVKQTEAPAECSDVVFKKVKIVVIGPQTPPPPPPPLPPSWTRTPGRYR